MQDTQAYLMKNLFKVFSFKSYIVLKFYIWKIYKYFDGSIDLKTKVSTVVHWKHITCYEELLENIKAFK